MTTTSQWDTRDILKNLMAIYRVKGYPPIKSLPGCIWREKIDDRWAIILNGSEQVYYTGRGGSIVLSPWALAVLYEEEEWIHVDITGNVVGKSPEAGCLNEFGDAVLAYLTKVTLSE